MKKIHKFTKNFCEEVIDNLSTLEMGIMQYKNEPVENTDLKVMLNQPSSANIWEVNDLEIINEVKQIILKEIPNVDSFVCNVLRLDNTKKNEEHVDTSDYTVIVLLNDNFSGGNLIVKKQNMGLEIGDLFYFPSSYKHYVEPVLSGQRYTLVLFVSLNKKNKKTLI